MEVLIALLSALLVSGGQLGHADRIAGALQLPSTFVVTEAGNETLHSNMTLAQARPLCRETPVLTLNVAIAAHEGLQSNACRARPCPQQTAGSS